MVQSLTDLPENMLMEILIRLPLKAICTSRCVCRTFLRLTSPLDSYFIALHSSKVTQSLVFQFGDIFRPSRLLRLVEPELDMGSGFVENFQWKPIFEIPKIQISNISYFNSNKFVLVNSCNGLLYLVRRHALDERSVVCNPVTNEYVMIPDVDEGSRLWTRTKIMWLGYSPCANQYKVLRIFSSRHGDPMEVGAQVLVVGSSSWRDIEDMPLGREHSFDEWSTFLNGVLYWLDHNWRDIVFFDYEREIFGQIALPPEFGEVQLENRQCMSIGVLGGCLCLSYNAYSDEHVNIWIMKKRGNQESWSKEFVIDTVGFMGKLIYGQFKPLQVLGNGEILMFWIRNDLVCYDPKNKSLRYFGFHWLRLAPKAAAFTPSFISLKDTLLVDEVMVHDVRPRGDETEP